MIMSALTEIAHLFPWFFPLAVTLFGACIGSFLNVCIYRMPKNESIVRPGSHCGCGQAIAWYDNIPVFSWFLLRGRARCCRQPFSFRYPAIELLTAALFLACWIQFSPAKALVGMVLCAIVICAWFIDLDHLIIPDVFTIGGAATGLILSLAVPALHSHSHPLLAVASLQAGRSAILGLFIGSALVLWIALFAEAILRKEAMGFGDVKYLGALGTFIGWQGAVFSLFGGALLGCGNLFVEKNIRPSPRPRPTRHVRRWATGGNHARGPRAVRPHARGSGTHLFFRGPSLGKHLLR